jgi:hypothetical protein
MTPLRAYGTHIFELGGIMTILVYIVLVISALLATGCLVFGLAVFLAATGWLDDSLTRMRNTPGETRNLVLAGLLLLVIAAGLSFAISALA